MLSSNRKLGVLSHEEAIDLPNDQKLVYFNQLIVKHTRMTDALDDLVPLANRHAGTDIVLLIGPTGVGKSATIAAAKERITRASDEGARNPGSVPVVAFEAPASGEHRYSWRLFYTRFLDNLSEPLVNRKATTTVSEGQWGLKVTPNGSTVAALRDATESALRNRSTRVVFIDEAAHLLANCNEKQLVSHMNALKSLSNVDTTLVLAGSYDLYRLITLSGQLARRSAVIHLTRYRTDSSEDKSNFRRALRTLQNAMPIKNRPDLMPVASALEMACIGCIGTLKDTLTRALSLTLEKGGKWSDDYLRRSLLSRHQVAAILEEILEGEKSLATVAYGGRTVAELMID